MASDQKHIINKLSIDVETSNPSAAFDLKDNINTFLKHDILPYLENYFSTIEEDLHSHVIQIPYVSVNVDTSSTLNYKELKEDVKRALTKEIKRVVTIAHPNSEEAKLTTQEQSKESTFLYFLETGTSPWWIKSEDRFELNQEDFENFLRSKSFLLRFKAKLMNNSFRNRMIHQLSDRQLVKVIESIDQRRTQKIWKEKFFKKMSQLRTADRKMIWDSLIDNAFQKNDEVFTSRLIFQFIQKLSKKEGQLAASNDKAFFQLLIALLNNFYTIEKVQHAINIVKNNPLFEQLNVAVMDEVENSNQVEEKEKTNHIRSIDVAQSEDQQESKRIKVEETSNENEVDPENHKELNVYKSIENERTTQNTNEKTQNRFGKKSIETNKDDENSSEGKLSEAEEFSSKSSENNDELLSKEKEHTNLSQIKESLSKLIDKEEHALFQEVNNVYNEQSDNSQLTGEIHINNVGLILLHPYLKDFFKHCNLLDEENQITNKALTVHLLHYLATKQEQQFENNMIFEKVLCGVPIQQSIQRTVKLSDELKENAEELLEAVLSNWGVLKNASPDLLRAEFLQRFGKISFKEVNPKITVERKVHDILLDKLPWNVGISRLPWLDYLLFTDW